MSNQRILNITYDYADVPTIRRFALSHKFSRFIVGPFRSGKSSGCCVEIYRRACAQAPNSRKIRQTRWAVVRGTYPQLRDTTIKTFLNWFPEGEEGFGHYRQTPTPDYMMVFRLPDGTTVESEVMFRALDKPEHVKNLLSLEVTGAYFNEVREIPKIIVDTMEGRVGQYPAKKDGGPTWSGVFGDTNPCDTDHWFYKLFEEDVPKHPELADKYEVFHQPSGRSVNAENITHLNNPNFYKELMVGKDPGYIRVFIDGQYGYVREGKIIYTNYVDDIHCSKDPLEPWRGIHLTLGWDFGLTPSCIVDQYHPKGFLRTLHEFCATEMGVKKLARDVVRPFLLANYQGFGIVSGCDPAGAQRSQIDETRSCYKELKECGFPVKLAYSNALEPRFTSVDNFLTKIIEGKPAYQLDPRCTMLRKGFNGEYKRRKLNIIGAEVYSEEPEKNAVSHPHEAHQYACMTIERGILPTSDVAFHSNHQPAKQPPRKAFA